MRQRYQAFTLIELVMASALAALLMLGVLTVLTGITRDRQRLSASRSSDAASRSVLVEIVRRDLSCSTELTVLLDGAIQLHSFAAVDASTLQPVDRPSLVTYRIGDGDGLGLLVRQQEMQDEPVQPLPLRSLLACHVRQFEVERLRDALNGSSDANAKAEADSLKQRDIPNRVRLRIAFSDSAAAIDQVLCLR